MVATARQRYRAWNTQHYGGHGRVENGTSLLTRGPASCAGTPGDPRTTQRKTLYLPGAHGDIQRAATHGIKLSGVALSCRLPHTMGL
ncbi:hypothetical protein NDU88_003015 [Pleurodeles waltl]|uniref:Uncharacterized protein n=1 Tax=Pleurodeles waltl TaxID=8319 RepID=A0AAV7W434_PLEWA|nr:hypothetical protein NDU88_003015 [Pleurodeles waltl]